MSRPRPIATIHNLVLQPFRYTPDDLTEMSARELDAARRFAFFRLIMVTVIALELCVGLPLTLILRVPLFGLIFRLFIVGLGLVCLLLLARGLTTVSCVVFITGTMIGLFFGSLLTAGLSPLRIVLAFSLQAIVILLAGLVLPLAFMRWLWLLSVGILAVCLWALAPHEFAPPDRILVFTFLVFLYTCSAFLSWFAVRSSLVGLDAMAHALQQEQELAQLKDVFIDDINHELRTPIMAMVNNFEILAAVGEQGAADARQRIVARGLRAGSQLLALLKSILDATSLETGAEIRVIPQTVNVHVETLEVIATFNPADIGERWQHNALVGRDVRVEMDETLTVWVDPTRFRQILINLVSNASKYSPPSESITIWARPTQRPLSGVEIGVADHGLGIPPADQPKLFRRFVRLERDITGSTRGTGLGLYTCKRLCDAMGGAIWIDSAGIPGEGTTMHVAFPGGR
jgi:signal transduction histidine kinase